MAWMRSGYKIKPSQPNYQSFGSRKAEPVTSKAELEQLRRGLGPAQGLAVCALGRHCVEASRPSLLSWAEDRKCSMRRSQFLPQSQAKERIHTQPEVELAPSGG